MRFPRPALAVAAVAAALVLAACTSPAPEVQKGASLSVSIATPFTSANPRTAHGRTATNADVGYLTSTGFGYYDPSGQLVLDTSFGKAEIVSQSPFRVRYTLADQVQWSDGTPIDATDLLLTWAAESQRLDSKDAAAQLDPATGLLKADAPADSVWFGAPGGLLRDAAKTPTISDAGRSIEVEYTHPVAGWQLALEPSVPAHVIAKTALKTSGASAGKKAVAAAIRAGSGAELAAIARAWNGGWDFATTPKDAALLVSSGPYRVKTAGEAGVELVRNSAYRGDRAARVPTLRLDYSADSSVTIGALAQGDLDVARLRIGSDFAAVSDVTSASSAVEASSRIDLVEANTSSPRNGAMLDNSFRRAFLLSIPRQEIVDQLFDGVGTDASPLQSWVAAPGDADYTTAATSNGSAAYSADAKKTLQDVLDGARVSDRSVCVLYDSTNPRRTATFEIIRDAAAEYDISVTDCGTADWRNRLVEPQAWDVALLSWDAASATRPGAVEVLQSDELAASPLDTPDSATAGALTALQRATTEAARTEALAELDHALWDNDRLLPLYRLPSVISHGQGVGGVKPGPSARSVLWNAWTWRAAAERPTPSSSPSS
ncbi:ABC transporter substrate-binding protein [Schumannella luteola]|uniref:Peptide/nickel transport system substrate-binding protein n=1 Tax=Schumannella luteola TaxID=472059 RepID=A0A852Y934_9MICO|nr:ABC transporter substrate-binding protein [Schumannella luteola]NYG99476.1 peptide/nickel transport system substrate-binding protein [Schumannella luteola]TPX03803.1 hypothetical protein FJ656_14790 [Schumannella luteola]